MTAHALSDVRRIRVQLEKNARRTALARHLLLAIAMRTSPTMGVQGTKFVAVCRPYVRRIQMSLVRLQLTARARVFVTKGNVRCLAKNNHAMLV